MVGDGSFLMMHTEIVTAIQEGQKLIIVLVDNGGFQSIHGLQMGSGTPSFGNELRFRNPDSGKLDGSYVPVDFVRTAEGLGAAAFTATTADELREALGKAKQEPRTSLVYIRVDPEIRVPNYEGWWDVPIAEVSGEASVRETRRQYEQDLASQRWYG
jgi:3D-(3,5/4)-trihydroxycyclohexane-1,2-dione acylhydrolase (decyclizing)